MPPTRPRPQRSGTDRPRPGIEESAVIDARYGLEPVFEPAAVGPDADRGATRLETIHCPYCGEAFETLLDLSAGSADYVEDCQICCQPIGFKVDIDAESRLERLTVTRTD